MDCGHTLQLNSSISHLLSPPLSGRLIHTMMPLFRLLLPFERLNANTRIRITKNHYRPAAAVSPPSAPPATLTFIFIHNLVHFKQHAKVCLLFGCCAVQSNGHGIPNMRMRMHRKTLFSNWISCTQVVVGWMNNCCISLDAVCCHSSFCPLPHTRHSSLRSPEQSVSWAGKERKNKICKFRMLQRLTPSSPIVHVLRQFDSMIDYTNEIDEWFSGETPAIQFPPTLHGGYCTTRDEMKGKNAE